LAKNILLDGRKGGQQQNNPNNLYLKTLELSSISKMPVILKTEMTKEKTEIVGITKSTF
jgi:hypothetical protein